MFYVIAAVFAVGASLFVAETEIDTISLVIFSAPVATPRAGV